MKKEQIFENALKQFKENSGPIKNNKKFNDFSAEIKRIEAAAAKKHPLVKEYINFHREAEKRPYTFIGRMAKEMRKIAAKQEVFKIAAEMCTNVEDKNKILNQIELLNKAPEMTAYENYLKGLKYLAGMTDEMEPEVERFFEDDLHVPLRGEMFTAEYDKFRMGEKRWLQKEKQIAEAEGRVFNESLYKKSNTPREKILQEYRNLISHTKARELFSKQNINFSSVERQFIGDYTSKEGALAQDPYNNRMTPTAFCMGQMLLKGYRLEDIMDPRALLEEKKKVGQEYIERREKKDTTWYATEMYKGGEAAMKAFHKYIADHKKEIKTEDDLAMHSNNLARLSTLCFDLYQELNRAKPYSDKSFKSEADITKLATKLEKYQCGGGTATSTKILYDPSMFCPIVLEAEIQRQISTKLFLDEIQKEHPDLDSVFIGPDEKLSINAQLGSMEDVKSLFDKDDNLDYKNINESKLKTLASMTSTEYVEKMNLSYTLPKKPLYVTNAPKETYLDKGAQMQVVVSVNNKQIVETNVPAKMDDFFKGLETKDIRGKAKNNSIAFENMMDAYDKIIEKFGAGELKNPEYISEMKKLKTVANAYISEKRTQKGYDAKTMNDEKINAKMLGLESGASIFTSQGKDRYEFAVNLVSNINNLEKKFNQLEKKEFEIEDDGIENIK